MVHSETTIGDVFVSQWVASPSREFHPSPASYFRGNIFYGLSPPRLIQEGLAKVCALLNASPLSLNLPRKSVVRLTARLDMTIAVEWDVKPQTKPIPKSRR